MRRLVVLLVALPSCSAPLEPEYDAKVPGELLGTYAVTADLGKDECGADLLGVEDPWRFQVRLSRSADALYWLNGREAISGSIDDAAETFQFSSRVDVPVRSPKQGDPGCTVSRVDRAFGKVRLAERELTRFEGVLEFEYHEKSASECFEIIGIPGGFMGLPCKLSYTMSAEREASSR